MQAKAEGFTLIELILVIVVVGILAAVVGPRFFDRQVFDERLYADEARAALRHAQKLALAGGCRIRFSLDTAGFRLWRDADCDSATSDFTAEVPDPATGQPPYAGSAPAGVALLPAGGFSVTFDALGRADQSVSASIGGHTLSVEAGTGLVR